MAAWSFTAFFTSSTAKMLMPSSLPRVAPRSTGTTIVDAVIRRFNGTFQVVYSPTVTGQAQGVGGVGAVDGGWRDFDVPAFSN